MRNHRCFLNEYKKDATEFIRENVKHLEKKIGSLYHKVTKKQTQRVGQDSDGWGHLGGGNEDG